MAYMPADTATVMQPVADAGTVKQSALDKQRDLDKKRAQQKKDLDFDDMEDDGE